MRKGCAPEMQNENQPEKKKCRQQSPGDITPEHLHSMSKRKLGNESD